jgi:hypothetical protein
MTAAGASPAIVDHARRILESAASEDVSLKAIGGIAVFVHATEDARHSLRREMLDMDFATSRQSARKLAEIFQAHGFAPNASFNALHGASRLMFIDEAGDRHVDVFVERFEMCHVVPFADRLAVDAQTLPLAELLLTKLQIVHLNRKDVNDTCSLLVSHPVGDHDHETVNAERVAELCAEDWGLQHTLELNLARVVERLPEVPLSDDERALVKRRIAELNQTIEARPKSRRWKLRARVGERKRWYEEPEEVDRSGLQHEAS